MEKLIEAVYGGLLNGSVLGLMAIGLTLIWGALRLLNLAHGAIYLVGGYVAWMLINRYEISIWPAFLVGILAAAVVGLILQFTLVNPILGKPGWDSASLIATVGAAITIESIVLLTFGARVKQMPVAFEGNFTIYGVPKANQGLFIIITTVIALALLAVFLRRSRYGMAIRAVSQQMDAARLMGIPTRQIFLIVMVVSAALAGLAGVLLSSIFYLTPTAGFNPMVQALVVTIFGGLGSVKGTIWAAYIIGLLGAFLTVYLGASWALPGLFLFMIVMLTIRPNGLFGLGEAQRL